MEIGQSLMMNKENMLVPCTLYLYCIVLDQRYMTRDT